MRIQEGFNLFGEALSTHVWNMQRWHLKHELCYIIQGSNAMEYRLSYRPKGTMSAIWERRKRYLWECPEGGAIVTRVFPESSSQEFKSTRSMRSSVKTHLF